MLSWCRVLDEERYLIVVNFSEGTSQALVRVPWDELKGKTWRLTDALSGETFDRNGDEMAGPGLYVDLGAWQCHFLQLNPL
jgi:hypothetical protein